MDTLAVDFIRVDGRNGRELLSLPAVLAAMMSDRIVAFPALRAHQRHAWHAFLAQLGALACVAAELAEPPEDESDWRNLLLGLAPGEAWCLIGPPDRPALLQPPLPDGIAGLKGVLETPDQLDMLVTAKNHDLKQSVMERAQPDDWLFALLTLQTMEGFLGAGNYGISRMNGGFANRPAVSLAPVDGGPGKHLRRDLRRLLVEHDAIADMHGYMRRGGMALVWLDPWDGTASLSPTKLDPLYIDICRRIRLFLGPDGRIMARTGSSKVARIAGRPGGVTGDPWAPLRADKDDALKVLTVDASGFGYRRAVDLMFPEAAGKPSLLQEEAQDDDEAMVLLLRALVRGQGKTEGYHERRVLLSRKRRLWRNKPGAAERIARIARERVRLAGEMQRHVLTPALYALFQNGPEKVNFKDRRSEAKAKPFLENFDQAVDATFFPELWREAEAEDEDAERAARSTWVVGLLDGAEEILRRADGSTSRSTYRRYRALVHAIDALRGRARHNSLLQEYLPNRREEPANDAAA